MQVLALLFAEKSCMWATPAQLLPFGRALLEKESEGQALITARKMPRAALFGPAVKARCSDSCGNPDIALAWYTLPSCSFSEPCSWTWLEGV